MAVRTTTVDLVNAIDGLPPLEFAPGSWEPDFDKGNQLMQRAAKMATRMRPPANWLEYALNLLCAFTLMVDDEQQQTG